MVTTNGSPQVPDQARGGFTVARRTFWQWLGFRQERCQAFIDDEDPSFAPGYMLLETAVMIDVKDRLRILVSGKALVSQAIRTDVHVIARKTAAVFSVLPPNYKVMPDQTAEFGEALGKVSRRARVASIALRSWRYVFGGRGNKVLMP